MKPVQDLRQDLRDGVILAYLIEIVGRLALDSDASLKQNMAFLPSMCPSEQIVGGGLVTKSCPTLVTPWTVACQAPLSMRFPRQEYWSGLPFSAPGLLPHLGIEPLSPALAGGFFTN